MSYKYHRSSTLAFPKTADYGCSIEGPRRPSRRVGGLLTRYLIVFAVWALAMLGLVLGPL